MAGEMSNVDTCLVAEQSSETDVSGLGLDCRVNKSRKSVRVVDGAQEMVCYPLLKYIYQLLGCVNRRMVTQAECP